MTDCTATLKNELTGPEALHCAFQVGHVHPEYGTDHAGPDEGPAGRTWWSDRAVGATPHVQEVGTDEQDVCTPLKVDGETVRVRGSGNLTEEGKEALTALVRAAKAKFVAEAPEQVDELQNRLRLAHQARRAKEHQLDGIRRALCDAGFMEEDDPYGHADLEDVIRQAGELMGPLLAEVTAARKFAEEMRDFCSPHGVAADYADRLVEVMDRAKETGR